MTLPIVLLSWERTHIELSTWIWVNISPDLAKITVKEEEKLRTLGQEQMAVTPING